MPTLPTRSFTTIVSNTVAGIQGRASQLIDFGTGSPLRAIVEGFAGLFLWFQTLALQLLTATRLSTSQGADVDTFTADFMPLVPGTASPRLGSQAASGQLTFARYTAASTTCFIPVGATVQSTDGSQNFQVTADPTFATYAASPQGYTLPANVGSILVPAAAITPGSGGNAAAGAISVITTPLVGIDTVLNTAAFTGGIDSESDAALKSRFSDYILGLSRGDYYGLASSIEGTEIAVQWQLVESYNVNGSFQPGFFFVIADDGSGAPSAAFIQIVLNAVYAVRPLSIRCTVIPPTVVYATVSLSIVTAAGFDHNVVVGLVMNAITSGINSLGLGNRLDYNRIAAWAYSVTGVIGATAVLVNGMQGDAASIEATLLSQDGFEKMPIYTIKCYSCVVS